MTQRALYDAALIEINKLEAPSMLLEDYNYLINKAIQQKVNKSYNLYEINQQSTDDLMSLKVMAKLPIKKRQDDSFMPNETANYYCVIPSNYWHMLNCVIQFSEHNDNTCKTSKSSTSLARKLTSDLYPSIINNAYFKPSPKTPYYRVIKNHAEDVDAVIDNILNPCLCNDDACSSSTQRTSIDLDKEIKDILYPACNNTHDYLLDLRCGDTNRYEPIYAHIDYLKTPNIVILTQEDLDNDIDNTPVMEFPDYICYEIINEFVKLFLENSSDPRLQTNIPINQTIGIHSQSNQ